MPAEPTSTEAAESSRKSKTAVILLAAGALVAVLLLLILDGESSRSGPSSQVAAAAAAVGQPDQPEPVPTHYALNRDVEHVKKVEAKLAPLAARFDDDEGGTPCERAFGSFQAYLEADVTKNNSTFVLPDRAVFLQRCSSALTEQEQLCLNASYQVKHRDVCEPIYRGLSEKVFERAPGDVIH